MTDFEYYIARFHDCLEASPASAHVNLAKLCSLIQMIQDEACATIDAENKVLREWIQSEKEERARLRGDSK